MTSTADPLPTAVFPAGQSTGGYPAGPMPVPGPGASRRDRLAWRLYRLHQRSPRWAGPAAAGLCIAGAIGYTFVTHPTSAGADSVPTCLAKMTTGFDCPGCGGTRAA